MFWEYSGIQNAILTTSRESTSHTKCSTSSCKPLRGLALQRIFDHRHEFGNGKMASTSNKSSQSSMDHMIMEAMDYPSARQDPTVYPGERPPKAYLLEGTKVRLIDFADPEDIHSGQIEMDDGSLVGLNTRLQELGATAFEDRIGVLAYGSNRNPGQILKKWSDARQQAAAKEKGFDHVQNVVPVLRGSLENIDVVVEQFV